MPDRSRCSGGCRVVGGSLESAGSTPSRRITDPGRWGPIPGRAHLLGRLDEDHDVERAGPGGRLGSPARRAAVVDRADRPGRAHSSGIVGRARRRHPGRPPRRGAWPALGDRRGPRRVRSLPRGAVLGGQRGTGPMAAEHRTALSAARRERRAHLAPRGGDPGAPARRGGRSVRRGRHPPRARARTVSAAKRSDGGTGEPPRRGARGRGPAAGFASRNPGRGPQLHSGVRRVPTRHRPRRRSDTEFHPRRRLDRGGQHRPGTHLVGGQPVGSPPCHSSPSPPRLRDGVHPTSTRRRTRAPMLPGRHRGGRECLGQ